MIKEWFALACASLTFGISLAAGDGQELTAHRVRKATAEHARGAEALRTVDLESATQHFRAALAIIDGFPPAHVGLGHVALKSGAFGEALSHYEAAEQGFVAMGDRLREFRLEQYHAAVMEGERIRDELARPILQAPDTGAAPAGSRNEGAEASLRNRRTALESRLREIEALIPPDDKTLLEPPPELGFFKGNALFQLGRVEDAIGVWELFATRQPAFGPVHNNLALAYLKTGRLVLARQSLDRARAQGVPVPPAIEAELERREGQTKDSKLPSP